MLAMTSITMARVTPWSFCSINLGYAQFRKLTSFALLISWPNTVAIHRLLTTDSQSGANAME